MGQFSWFSVDTGVPIYNDKPAGSQTVTMVYKDESGEIKRVTETDYEGYGEFGGVDFYDAIAWMNNLKDENVIELRLLGIDFYFSEVDGFFPQLFLGVPPSDDEIDFTIVPEGDPNQGWSFQEPDLDYDEFDTYNDFDYDDDEYDDDYEDDDEEDEEDDDD